MGEQLAIGRKALPQFCYVKTYVRDYYPGLATATSLQTKQL